MKLMPEQIQRFEREGYLFFPSLFSREEIAVLNSKRSKRRVTPSMVWCIFRMTRSISPVPLLDGPRSSTI